MLIGIMILCCEHWIRGGSGGGKKEDNLPDYCCANQQPRSHYLHNSLVTIVVWSASDVYLFCVRFSGTKIAQITKSMGRISENEKLTPFCPLF